ncbi:CPBP family intramembrane glutamic endopeptidase [Paenibacillus elgii]|uniref:CPBP family intramembrane glutamic endopeptidase n=1 Tax=Paenibacillus elgii TaxID=189691 RepID=UPI0020415A31|nr:CPBP family intramembrane glutamic endopeptidase [Paenibacillus elgii]MCM3268974.1 CPBP family intramembrane metalloprotease [Paenibacillus elgii]
MDRHEIPILFLGPTVMIAAGLQGLHSVPLTFALFYGWLLLVPLESFILRRRTADLAMTRIQTERKQQWQKTDILLGIGSGAAFFGAIVAAAAWFHPLFLDIPRLKGLLQEWHFSGEHTIWLVLVLLVLNPLLEEAYWRGYVLRKLTDGRVSPAMAVFLTSLFYSLYHVLSIVPIFERPWNIALVLPVFTAGLFWGWMRLRHASLTGSVLSHSFADAGIMGIYFLYLS